MLHVLGSPGVPPQCTVRPRPCTMVFVVVMVCAGWKAQESLFLCTQWRYLGWGSKLCVVWVCSTCYSLSHYICPCRLPMYQPPWYCVIAMVSTCWKAMKSPPIYIQGGYLCFGSKLRVVWVCGIYCRPSQIVSLPLSSSCTMVSLVCGGDYGLEDTSWATQLGLVI